MDTFLSFLPGWGAVSYVTAHWELMIIVILSTVALGYLAFVLRNWKVALAAIVLVCGGLAYQSANMAGYDRRVAEDVAAQTKIYKERLEVYQSTALADAKRALADQATITNLERMASETPKNNHVCFDAAAARRVSRIR